MKRLLLAIALLCPPCWPAVAHVTSSPGFCIGGAHGGNIAANCTTGTSYSFTFTPTNTGDAVFFGVGSGAASTSNVISLSATGWSFTSIACTGATSCTSGTFGTSANRAAVFWAFAPSTAAATITVSVGVSTNNFGNDLTDEFSGTDGTNPVDASQAIAGSGSCSTSVTPTLANDGLWGSCVDSVTAVGSGFTKGSDDTQQDWSEWKILSGGSGVAQTISFSGSGTFESMGVAIKPPSAGATCPHNLTLLGIGCS